MNAYVFKILMFIFVVTISFGCDRFNKKTATLTINIPTDLKSTKLNTVNQKVSTLAAGGPSWATSLLPSSINDINCYAVFVAGPEVLMSQNSCEKFDGTQKFTFGPHVIFFKEGQEISIDVPSGKNRRIYLAGVKAQNGACKILGPDESPDFSNMSVPHILAAKTNVDLPPGDVTINITATLDSIKTFQTCDFIQPPTNGGGGNTELLFGDGRDGNFTASAGGIANLSSSLMTTSTFTNSNNLNTTVAKNFSATIRVTNIDEATRKSITVESALTAAYLEEEDEILWHVVAASGTTPGPDGICGGNLYRGAWGTGKVLNITNDVITLDNSVTEDATTINNAAIANENYLSTSSFCYIQLSRVPNIDTLTINSMPLTLKTNSLSLLSGTRGGMIFIRVKNLILNDDLTFNSDNHGFQSAGGNSGSGLTGLSASGINNLPNSSGGAGYYLADGGAGGGNGGTGGNNNLATTAGLSNADIGICAGPCLPIGDKKIILGGAGGGGNGIYGGAGGGAVILHIGNISGPGSLFINANGENGVGVTGGGGAGGTVHLTTDSITSTGSLQLSVDGGHGISTPSGGGGGGIAEVKYCSYTTAPILSALGGGGGNAGVDTSATGQILQYDPGLCGAN